MNEAHRPLFGAKIILLRPTQGEGFEAFLIRDPDDASKVGFPGGAVTRDDYSSGMLNRCRGLNAAAARSIIGARFTPQEASGPWVAGIRHLFLEVGILLAVDKAGRDPMRDPEWAVRLQNQRDALRPTAFTFETFLIRQGLWADASKLVYFSSWKTGAQGAADFRSHFYLATLAPDQTSPLPALPRVIRGMWLSPDRAVLSCEQGELPMSFATFASLRTLADFNSVQSLSREYGSGRRE